MPAAPLAIRITHSGLYQDGRPNLSSFQITDIDHGLDEPQTRQNHRSAVYVPVGGFIELPLTTRVLQSYVAGQISKVAASGLATVSLVGMDVPYQREVLAADVSSSGDVLGATTETVLHTTTLTAAFLAEVGRRILITGMMTAAFNAADTWTLRVRIGGLTGEVVLDSGALVAADGTDHQFQVDAIVRTVGAGGTFNSYDTATHSGALAPTGGFNMGGVLDTTTDVDVVFTVESSSANAGQTIVLTDWSAQILSN